MNSFKRNSVNGLLLRAAAVILISALVGCTDTEEGGQSTAQKNGQPVSKPKNVIYVLTDDQRYDELGFMNPVIDTPNMDRMAAEGVHFENAFVTTALCSPSRASILTGQYMHNHGVVDNNKPPRDGTIFFPEYLQKAGYNTAFVG
ncbi:MAG: N-acetylglucosamine-6-sulfatase, partial [Porticoccaceae bacterium]